MPPSLYHQLREWPTPTVAGAGVQDTSAVLLFTSPVAGRKENSRFYSGTSLMTCQTSWFSQSHARVWGFSESLWSYNPNAWVWGFSASLWSYSPNARVWGFSGSLWSTCDMHTVCFLRPEHGRRGCGAAGCTGTAHRALKQRRRLFRLWHLAQIFLKMNRVSYSLHKLDSVCCWW